ncbi:ABC transporter ATP-binding protein [Nitrosomonas halophila]|uniref:Lipopolysaccharide transport system ATP-binding protein n=1 Tax=Nitrosomonas halophila TaxID=44576 RepID=A0A1H3EIC9_9PROT|nr:ABC transporter ATP-binding protein [Nitrosomonas halophila]SDX77674.1 lipopolysaccharide transport system ATP-binding protein [Nitrosomonas halophila]
MTALAIHASQLGKCYHLYAHPRDRLKQFLWRGRRHYYRELWALRNIDLTIAPGEVIGIMGRNGSGKSTLLQLICGTLTPSCGEVAINGRLAALLELGAGFNPEFTGRENIWLNAAIMGLSQEEISARLESMIEFSGIGDFIDQPVKTYSSGMYVRLAFSVAINVDPDILVIDEALSVGDGAFARKSFERIMQLRDMGKTILFCSHSLFQIESLCNRALWIERGQLMAEGETQSVTAAYQMFLDKQAITDSGKKTESVENHKSVPSSAAGTASSQVRLENIVVEVDGKGCDQVLASSGRSTVSVKVAFVSDPGLPCPNIGVTVHATDDRVLSSAGTWEDHVVPAREQNGKGVATLVMAHFPMLKGEYTISVFLLCERGIHLYDSALGVATVRVQQSSRLQGYFVMPHQWKVDDE